MTGAMRNLLGQSGSECYLRYDRRTSGIFLEREASKYIDDRLSFVDKLRQASVDDEPLLDRIERFNFDTSSYWALPLRIKTPVIDRVSSSEVTGTASASETGEAASPNFNGPQFSQYAITAPTEWSPDTNWITQNMKSVKEHVVTTYSDLEKTDPSIPFDSPVGQGILTGAMWNILGQSGTYRYTRGGQRDDQDFLHQETSDYIRSQFDIVNKLRSGESTDPIETSPDGTTKAAIQSESNNVPYRSSLTVPTKAPTNPPPTLEFAYDIADFKAGQPDTDRFYLPSNAKTLPAGTIEKTYRITAREVPKALEQGYIDKNYSNSRRETPDMQWNMVNVDWLRESVTATYNKLARNYSTFAYDPEVSSKVMKGAMSFLLNRSGTPFFTSGLRNEKDFMGRQAALYIGGRLKLLDRIKALGGDANGTESTSTPNDP
jgi:hypothetical protein